MEGSIDPPSSLNVFTLQTICDHCTSEEVWVCASPPLACLFLTRKKIELTQQTGLFTASSQKGLSAMPNWARWNTRSGAWLKKLQLQTRVELTENDRFFEHLRFVKTTKTRHDGYNRTTSITMKKAVSRNGEPWTKSLSKVEGLQAYNLNWCCIKSAYPLIFLKPVEK